MGRCTGLRGRGAWVPRSDTSSWPRSRGELCVPKSAQASSGGTWRTRALVVHTWRTVTTGTGRAGPRGGRGEPRQLRPARRSRVWDSVSPLVGRGGGSNDGRNAAGSGRFDRHQVSRTRPRSLPSVRDGPRDGGVVGGRRPGLFPRASRVRGSGDVVGPCLQSCGPSGPPTTRAATTTGLTPSPCSSTSRLTNRWSGSRTSRRSAPAAGPGGR